METAIFESSVAGRRLFASGPERPPFFSHNRLEVSVRNSRYPFRVLLDSCNSCCYGVRIRPQYRANLFRIQASVGGRKGLEWVPGNANSNTCDRVDLVRLLFSRGIVLGGMVCGMLLLGCSRVQAAESVVNVGYGVREQLMATMRSSWPKVLQLLKVFKEQGLVLAALLGLSAFFSMAETSITTLWPWKVRELAEKEPDDGVFKMLRSDVTRFLTTILIGTTVVNIGATALVTEAATAIFGEAGVSAATAVMTVAILLLTEITPKSIAVHHATEVARIVVKPVAWLSLVLYPVGRVVTYLSMGILKMLGQKGRSELYVTEDELKLMLRGAELSGAIEEEEQATPLTSWSSPFLYSCLARESYVLHASDDEEKILCYIALVHEPLL